MKLSASVLILLAILGAPGTASAQGDPAMDCARGVTEACWTIRFGRCAHQDPQTAIRACTRQINSAMNVYDTPALNALKRMDDAQRYTLRGTAHAKLGDIEEALEDYDRAIRTHNRLYWVHALRASALYATGSESDALVSLNEAIDLAPDAPLLISARARLLSTAFDENVRDSAQAISDAQKASELAPGRPSFVAVLATIYAESGDFDNAVETQLRAIGLLEPDDQEALSSYQNRLALYEQGVPVERQFNSCGAEDTDNPDSNNQAYDYSQFLVFCFDDGNS